MKVKDLYISTIYAIFKGTEIKGNLQSSIEEEYNHAVV